MSFDLKFPDSERPKVNVHPDTVAVMKLDGPTACLNFISDDHEECCVFVSADIILRLIASLAAIVGSQSPKAGEDSQDGN